ncbi:hypothetical protein EYF80_026755 [Liparis tanakae]|uniref:Uncharacterized protein n=1 Tax=Liparis tanakae TaxID=230148 RepID=A0A4Z2HAV2_9TELE|nr:hypothetical protein EYF80_026755 [Liparis tanakae]
MRQRLFLKMLSRIARRSRGEVRLQRLGGLLPVPGRSGWASLGHGLGLVHLLALVVVLVFLLVVLGVLGKLLILVRLLLELPDLQTPQVDEEEKTGPHRHKQGTPVVPGRDRYIRRAPLQPEQDSAVRIHILQLHPRNSRSPIRPRFINPRANEKRVEVGQSLNSGAAGEPEQERWFHHHPPPRASPKLSSRQDRGVIVTRSRYPRCEPRRAIMCRNSGENVYSIHPERLDLGCATEQQPGNISSSADQPDSSKLVDVLEVGVA